MSPQEGGPTSLLRAAPGRVLWAKTRPPGAHLRAPTLGLAPGWGPGNADPGDVRVLDFISIIRGHQNHYFLKIVLLTIGAGSLVRLRHGRQKVSIPNCNLTGRLEERYTITLLPVSATRESTLFVCVVSNAQEVLLLI